MAETDFSADSGLDLAREIWGDDAEAKLAALRERADELRRLSDPRLQPARRTCLGPLCQGRRRFESESAGNRLCLRCRRRLAENFGEYAEAS